MVQKISHNFAAIDPPRRVKNIMLVLCHPRMAPRREARTHQISSAHECHGSCLESSAQSLSPDNSSACRVLPSSMPSVADAAASGFAGCVALARMNVRCPKSCKQEHKQLSGARVFANFLSHGLADRATSCIFSDISACCQSAILTFNLHHPHIQLTANSDCVLLVQA